ncbi:MAG TPA: hypothetical protein VN799_07675, partial [Acidimicrobiales bacterium]|nr:hypothetical protein [Acidimicrobiales bacterium]
MRRLLTAVATVAALAMPASIAAFTLSSPASAAGSSVTCKKLTGTITGNITISKCSPKSKTNKSASGVAASLATGGTVTWS